MVPCRVAREMAWSTTLQAAMTAILKADHLVMRTHVQVRKHRQYPKKHKTTKIILFLRPQILHWKLSDGWRWLESHQILGNRGRLPNGFQNLELSWECFRRDPVATAPWIFHEQLQGRIQNRFPCLPSRCVTLQLAQGLKQSGSMLIPKLFLPFLLLPAAIS